MVQVSYCIVQARNLTGYESVQLTNPACLDLVAGEVVPPPPSLQAPNKKARLEFPSTLWNYEACTYYPYPQFDLELCEALPAPLCRTDNSEYFCSDKL